MKTLEIKGEGEPKTPSVAPQKATSAYSGPALRIRGLHKKYGNLHAVDNVDLEVPEGEIFALLGPNGAGKSTLIHCITGLAVPTSGSIEVFGHDVGTHFQTTRRLVGLVPQEITYDPFFTPQESLLIQMGFMGLKPDPKWANQLLETFALWQHRRAYTRALSGGMKRRLLIAKALAHRPKLLFLDEPTAGVDVELRQEVWREVKKLRDRGTTIILTTHYLQEAEELADRVGMIRSGKIVLVEDKKTLLDNYQKRFLVVALKDRKQSDLLPKDAWARDDGRWMIPWESEAHLEQLLAELRGKIAHLEFSQTTLEDIFVNVMHQRNPGGSNNRGSNNHGQ